MVVERDAEALFAEFVGLALSSIESLLGGSSPFAHDLLAASDDEFCVSWVDEDGQLPWRLERRGCTRKRCRAAW